MSAKIVFLVRAGVAQNFADMSATNRVFFFIDASLRLSSVVGLVQHGKMDPERIRVAKKKTTKNI